VALVPDLLFIPAIPGRYVRGGATRADISYAIHAVATWQWWCRRQGIELRVLREPPAGAHHDSPPLIQRWVFVEAALREAAPGTRVAVVDADTMVHWQAPNFLQLAGHSLGAVQAGNPRWQWRTIRAYQSLFPDVPLRWWEYFNAGLLVLQQHHRPLLLELLDFYQRNRAALEEVQRSGDFGIDQTLLNFLTRKRAEQVQLLPGPFNLVNCCVLPPRAWIKYEQEGCPDLSELLEMPGLFDFVNYGFVWHFTGNQRTRTAVMAETWRRVCANYPPE
jgi:hypothetical protein